MSDYNAGLLTSGNQLIKSILYLMLTFGVERTCCLVEKDDFRLANECPRDSDALLLTSRESNTALANHTVEAIWEELFILDEIEAI